MKYMAVFNLVSALFVSKRIKCFSKCIYHKSVVTELPVHLNETVDGKLRMANIDYFLCSV